MTEPSGLAAFLGDWSLDRQIDDRRARATGRLVGQVSFTAEGQGLLYRETGLLHFGSGAPMQATRAYRWHPANDGATVAFDDGRPFHHLPWSGGPVEHLCGADLYIGEYDFTAWPSWRVRWRVRGPAKDYAMDSLYQRA